jgi:O-antigen/teichoic acid export membrane protein
VKRVSHLGMAVVGVRSLTGLLRTDAFDITTSEGRSRERHRRVMLSAIAAAAARAISVATALITVPLTLHYLGAERYGMWMTMSSVITMFGFADLGMGYGILNVVAQSNGTDDRLAIRAVGSSGFFALSIIAAAIVLAFWVAYPFISLPEIFNVHSEAARQEAGPALACMVACFAMSVPLAVVTRVQMGLQQGYAASLWLCLGSVLGLIGVLAVILLKGGLPWLVIGFLGGPIIASIINVVHFYGFAAPDLTPRRELISRSMVVRIASVGSLFFGLQIAMAVAFASDNLVIAHLLGAEVVTQYAVPEKLFGLIGVIVGIVLQPLWPAYGEAIARGDRRWVSDTLLRSLFASIGVTTVLSATLIVFGPWIISVWTGPTVVPSFALLLGLGIWKVIEAGGNAVSMFLNGANVIRFQLVLAALMASLAVVLKIFLVTRVGLAGVVWATVIANLAIVPLMVWFIRGWLRR